MDLLTYKRLLYYLSVFFGDGEFDSADVSRRFKEHLAPIDGANLLTSKLESKLISNRLRRLYKYDLVRRGKKEVPIKYVTKSGKLGHRGGHFKYKINQRGFTYLRTTKPGPWSGEELRQAMLFPYIRKTNDPTLLALADSVGALPPTWKGITNVRKTRLPNNVTFRKEVYRVADQVRPIVQEKFRDSERQRLFGQAERREAAKARSLENIVTNIKKEQKERAKEAARLEANRRSESEAEMKRIMEEFKRKLEPYRDTMSKTSPKAVELMNKLLDKGDSEQENSSVSGSYKSDAASDGNT